MCSTAGKEFDGDDMKDMKFFLDTEFIEDGVTIDLISIGIVAEDGREYYAVSSEFDPTKASQWVKDNVLVHLPLAHGKVFKDFAEYWSQAQLRKTRKTI